jgi:hypothetical protein
MKSVIVLMLVMLITLGGCASAPKVNDPSGVDVSVLRLSPDQAMMLSFVDGPNPYQVPGGVFTHPHEYIVLRFEVVAARKGQVSINSIVALGPDDASVARYDYLDDFCGYIASWNSPTVGPSIQVVKNTYLPGDSFTATLGHRTYYAVLIGKNPIPRPFQVKVDVSVDNGDPRIFTFDVTK